MVIAIDFGFVHREHVIEFEGPEIRNMMTFPVHHSLFESLHGGNIVRMPLGLIYAGGEALAGLKAFLDILYIRIWGTSAGFDIFLQCLCIQFNRNW